MFNKTLLLIPLFSIFICNYTQAEILADIASDGKSAYIEGMMHLRGIHYPQNNQKAFDLIKQSAQTNHAKAQYQLATFYFKGIAVPKDVATAIYWLDKSAAQGHEEAQLVLNSLPKSQRNLTISNTSSPTSSSSSSNLATAVSALRQEVEKKLTTELKPLTTNSINADIPVDATALTNDIQNLKQEIQQSMKQQQPANTLSLVESSNTPPSPPAHTSTTAAANIATPPQPAPTTLTPINTNTVSTISTLEKKTEPTENPVTAKSTLEGYPLLTSLLEEQGKASATMNTQAYPQDKTSAIELTPGQQLLTQVIKSNHELPEHMKQQVNQALPVADPNNPTDANQQFNLALQYFKGTNGIKQDYEQAYYWFKRSADQGNAKAQFNIGNIYFKGLGVDINYEQAYQWYKKSAEQADAFAQFNLGFIYLNGLSVKKNINTAINYFEESARSGFAKAQLSLGIIYLEGNLINQDLGQAAKWIQRSRVQGEPQAQSIWNKYELWKYWKIEP